MKSSALIKPYFTQNKLFIFIGLISLIVVDLLQLLIPLVIKWAVDDLTAFRADSKGLIMYAFYVVGIALAIGVFRYIWRRCLIGMSRQVEEGLRNKLFAHIQTLSAPYFAETKTGDLMAHATNDIQHIRMATGMGIVALTDALVLGTAAIGFMAAIHLRLTIYVLIPMPFIVLSARFFTKRMHHNYQAVQGAFADLTEVVRERFAGIRIIKAYNREKESGAGVQTASKAYVDKNLKLARIMRSFFPMMLFFSNMSLGLVLLLGGRQTIKGSITPGEFVAFISYIGMLTWPMMATGWVMNLIQRGKASLDRIHQILQTPPQITDSPGAVALEHIRGEIVFENVSFSYASNDYADATPVIVEIDLKLKPGQTLGIVGPPGSGKTTLLGLVPRIFDVSQGRILIDGVDIRNVRLEDLRSRIGFMPQEPFLFAASIRENIMFDDSRPQNSVLINAAKAASLHGTVQALPDGFETLVGEKGIILSGGQKQRVALARTMLYSKPILILDDPISQVDSETGNDIINRLRSLTGKMTLIIVSHRLSAVHFADHIVVLEQGRIAESGTHAQLMESDRYYARTYRMQELEEVMHAR
ncbi:MAG: ABC transporter ATP-binding protein [Desulfobacterales bacterium]